MSRLSFAPRAAIMSGMVAVTLMLSGCSYDYWQHTDRVAYGAGNAVRANLVQSTTNPSSNQMNSTEGLGQNGVVVPATQEVSP